MGWGQGPDKIQATKQAHPHHGTEEHSTNRKASKTGERQQQIHEQEAAAYMRIGYIGHK